jgi:hypothetical protein
MPIRSRKSQQASSASFVFKGTLKKLRSATMPTVPVDEQTAIVRVDEILTAPDALDGYAGQDITVRLSQAGPHQIGQQLIFYTNSWLYGDSVAVQSLKEVPVESAATASRRAARAALKTRLSPDEPEHFAAADLVVFGKVMAVRLPSATRASEGPTAGEPFPAGPISEHSANWREAVVKITATLKGHPTEKQIIVRFPLSTDIRWHQVPKFQPGQEGYFLLHHTKADEAEKRRWSRKAGAQAVPPPPADSATYTILHAEDFQPQIAPAIIARLAGEGKN